MDSQKLDAQNLARWTRFALKGGIGRCVAVQDCVAQNPEDLMFLKGDEIVVLVQLSEEGRFLGYCEGVVGQFSAADVHFTTKLKKAVFAKRPGSSSSSTTTHATNLLIPGGISATSSPTGTSFRGSIMAEPLSRPVSVSANISLSAPRRDGASSSGSTPATPLTPDNTQPYRSTSRNSTRTSSGAALSAEYMPPASSVVRPSPSMLSPPTRTTDLPPSGRSSPTGLGGRISPGTALRSAASPPPSNRVLSPSQSSRVLSPPPSSTPSSPAQSRILNAPNNSSHVPSSPPGSNSTLPTSRIVSSSPRKNIHQSGNSVAARSRTESGTGSPRLFASDGSLPPRHVRDQTDEPFANSLDDMTLDAESFTANMSLSDPFAPPAMSSSLISTHSGSSAATHASRNDPQSRGSTDVDDDGDMLRRMRAFPTPPTTIPHGRTLSSASRAGYGMSSPNTSPRSANFAAGISSAGTSPRATTFAQPQPQPQPSPRQSNFGQSGLSLSPRMQSFSAMGPTLPPDSPQQSPRSTGFGGAQTLPATLGSSSIPSSASTGSLGKMLTASSASPPPPSGFSRSASSNGLDSLPQQRTPSSHFASHTERGGPPPPRPPRSHSRASSRASVASSIVVQSTSGSRPNSASGHREKERQRSDTAVHSRDPSFASTVHSRSHSRSSSYSASRAQVQQIHSREPSNTNRSLRTHSRSGSGSMSVMLSRNNSKHDPRSGSTSASGSAPGSRSSTPARLRELEARELELDIQTALATMGGPPKSTLGSSLTVGTSGIDKRRSHGLGGTLDSPPDTARLDGSLQTPRGNVFEGKNFVFGRSARASPNPASGSASPVPPRAHSRTQQESTSTASSASLPGSHAHGYGAPTSQSQSQSRSHSRSTSRNFAGSSHTHTRSPSHELDIDTLERELQLDEFARRNRDVDESGSSDGEFEVGSGSASGTDSERENGRGPFALDPLHRPTTRKPSMRKKLSLKRGVSQRHQHQHQPMPNAPNPVKRRSQQQQQHQQQQQQQQHQQETPHKRGPSFDIDEPLLSSTTFGTGDDHAVDSDGEEGNIRADDDVTLEGHGPPANAGSLQQRQHNSPTRMERERTALGLGLNYEAVVAQRSREHEADIAPVIRTALPAEDAPLTARPDKPMAQQPQTNLTRSDTARSAASMSSTRSGDGVWDIGVSLMQGALDSSDDDDDDAGQWSNRRSLDPPQAAPQHVSAQPISSPPQPRSFLHPGDANAAHLQTVGRASPHTGRYSPSNSSTGANSGGGYSPSAASSNIHGESSSWKRSVPTMESPRNLPQPGPARDVHDRDTLRATPQSPPATESVSIQQAETVPTTIPAAQKVDDEDEDEEDGDAEEWDGDSIYDGYRYSRISMVSKRASRFTTASDKMPAFGAGAQFGSMASMGSTSTVGSGPGFGSPELPARARAVSERSGSPRSVGIGGKRSGESSPASPNFPGRRAATPNSPSSPLGPGLAAHAARVGASPIPVQMRDDVPTFNNLTTNSPRVGTPNNTTNARWTPSPILPLTPTRRVDFGSQQVVKPVHPHAASPVPAMSPSQATSPSGDEEPTPTKTTRPPSHLAVTPRPHPPIQPVENPFARPRAHEKELSSDRGSVITLAREGLDLQAVQSNAGLDMIAEVHISPDKDDAAGQYASIASPGEALLAKGTFSSPPASATSSAYDHSPSPRGQFVFPPRKNAPPPPLPHGGRNIFTGMVNEQRSGPLSASPEPLDEDLPAASINLPRQVPQAPAQQQPLRVEVPPASSELGKDPGSPSFPLLSATALRARFQEERGSGQQSGLATVVSADHDDDAADKVNEDSDGSVYSSAAHSRAQSLAQSRSHSRSNTQDDGTKAGMRILTEDEPSVPPLPQSNLFSPADPILPLSARPGDEPEGIERRVSSVKNYVDAQQPHHALLQQSRFGDSISRLPDSSAPPEDLDQHNTPRAAEIASFVVVGTPQRFPQALPSPDIPSPTSMQPRPIGPGMNTNSGRNSPAPANFLPHPNAPISRTARLLPGTGVGSGVFNPYAKGSSISPSTEAARRPPPLQETMAMAASRRNMTIKARMQFDLSSSNAPVPIVWSMMTEAEAREDDQQQAAQAHAQLSGPPSSPIRASPLRGGSKGPHPLSHSVSVPGVTVSGAPPFGSTSAGPAGPGASSWQGANTPSHSDPATGRTGTSAGLSPHVPLTRGQFAPHVGGPRPRSRSFSGFAAVNEKQPLSSSDDLRSGRNAPPTDKMPLLPRPIDNARSDDQRQGMPGPQRIPQRMPSMPSLAPAPLSIPTASSASGKVAPSSPLARPGVSPISISPGGGRRFGNDEPPGSPLASSPRRATGLRHASSAMNLGSNVRSQSPALVGASSVRPSRTSGSAPHHDEDGASNDGHGTASAESGSRPTRSISLRSKLSHSAMRAKMTSDSQGEETVNVQDMEFELVRPFVHAAREEGRPSTDSRDHDSIRSGRESIRSGSPAASSHAHDQMNGFSPTRGPLSPVKTSGSQSQASLDAYRAREQKWMTLISTTSHKSKKVRKLVLEGVPASVRSRVWAYLTDSKSRQTPGVFAQLSSKGSPQLAERIEGDVQRLFAGEAHLTEPKGRGPVLNILQAYFVMVPDVPYQPDVAIVAGNLALQCPEEEAFWTLVQLMESHLRGYFSAMPVQLDVDATLFAKAVDHADSALSIRLFADMHVPPVDLCQSWFLSLFARTLPSEIQHRVWDIFLFEGPTFLFRVGLALLHVVRRQIFSMQGMAVPQIIAFLARPPPQAFHPDPEAFVQLCFTMKLKEDELRKARIKNAEQQLKERQLGRFASRPGARR